MMKQDSRSFRKLGALAATAVTALCFCLAVSAEEAQKGKEQMVTAEGFVEQGELLTKKLAEKALWVNPKNKDKLLGYLKVASILRAKSLSPQLVSRIAYNPYPNREDKRKRALGEIYPVYGVLINIGAFAVPDLLAELRKTNPKNTGAEDRYLKHVLLIFCIRDIYDQGGHGTALAKKRLELELAATKDKKAKANLQATLDHPIFKEEKDAKKK